MNIDQILKQTAKLRVSDGEIVPILHDYDSNLLFDAQGNLLYEHREQGILDFAKNKSNPLSFISGEK
jgi:hypothetical protein